MDENTTRLREMWDKPITDLTTDQMRQNIKDFQAIPAGDAFQPVQGLKLPEQDVFPSPADAVDAERMFSPEIARQQETVKAGEAERKGALSSIQETFQSLIGAPQQAIATAEEMGIPQMMTDLAEIDGMMAIKQQSLRRELQMLESRKAVPASFIRGQQNRLNIQATREMADLAVVRHASQGRLDAAQDWVDRKTEAEVEGLRAKLQYEQFVYGENKEILTKAQDRSFQLEIARAESEYNEQREKRQQINNMALQAAQFGATADQLKEIGESKNFEQALGVAGSFLGKPFQLQVEAQEFNRYIQEAQLSIAWSQLAAQKQAAADAITMEARKMSREDIDLARKDVRVTNFETIQSIKNRVDHELANYVDDEGMLDWSKAATSNSTIWAMANAAGRSQNPEMTRAIGELGLTGTASVEQKVEAMYNKLLKDATANPGKLSEMYNLLDSAHTAATWDLQDAMVSLQSNVYGFALDQNFFMNQEMAADSFVQAALQDPSVMMVTPQNASGDRPADVVGGLIYDWYNQ